MHGALLSRRWWWRWRKIVITLVSAVIVMGGAACNLGTKTGPVSAIETRVADQRADDLSDNKQVVFISLAPSPYSNRHDCMRAGFGIYLLLRDHVEQLNLPIVISYYDGSEFFQDQVAIAKVLNIGDVYIMGGSTWSQGPAFYVRRFFEIGGLANMMGVSASAWSTSGGTHTGGAEVVHSILRSMMGMGANVFTLGQKYLVFTTDERLHPATPGAFSRFDMWYMDQFSRMIAVQALAEGDREEAQRLGVRLGVSPFYFKNTARNRFPPSPELLNQYDTLLALINSAADPDSKAWKNLTALLSSP